MGGGLQSIGKAAIMPQSLRCQARRSKQLAGCTLNDQLCMVRIDEY